MRSFLIMLAFIVVVIGSAQDVPVKKRLYADMILETNYMSPEQFKVFNRLYNHAKSLATRHYGESLSDKGASCVMSNFVYEYKYNFEFKNIKFKPREKLLNFMNKHCSDKVSEDLFKDLKDIINVYHIIVLDGPLDKGK